MSRNYWESSAFTAALTAIASCLPTGCRAAAAPASLCLKREVIVFSCHIDEKIVSLCRPFELPKQLIYRYGRPGKPELVYPSSATGEKAAFLVSTAPLYGGGVTSVGFARNGYEYRIYSKIGRTPAASSQERTPEFEDGVVISSEGNQIKRLICDDGGEGFHEPINWLPHDTGG